MKHIIFSTLLFFAFALSIKATPWQKVLLSPTDSGETINVPDGKIIEFHDFFYNRRFTTSLDFGDGINIEVTNFTDSQFDIFLIGKEKSYVGPLTVSMSLDGNLDNGDYLLTWYRLVNNPDDLATTPQGSVVIPEDLDGPITITLESSTDLKNWTTANPGSYGTSSQRRYFRLRAVTQ